MYLVCPESRRLPAVYARARPHLLSHSLGFAPIDLDPPTLLLSSNVNIFDSFPREFSLFLCCWNTYCKWMFSLPLRGVLTALLAAHCYSVAVVSRRNRDANIIIHNHHKLLLLYMPCTIPTLSLHFASFPIIIFAILDCANFTSISSLETLRKKKSAWSVVVFDILAH